MSERISLPGARVPLVGADGLITREWLMWFTGMFSRVGGPVGFSNSELYGDAVTLQSYDELLERISGLEALARELTNNVQMLALRQMEMPTTAQLADGETLEKLTVRGMTRLATNSGQVIVGSPATTSTAALHAAGPVDATEYHAAGVKVVGERETGYVAMSGAGNTSTSYAVGSVTLPQLAGRVKALQDTLATHGLIGA